MKRKIVVAITGASGAVYGVRLIEVLLAATCDIHLSISASAQTVIRQELDLTVDLDRFEPQQLGIDASALSADRRLAAIRKLAGATSEQSHVLSVGHNERGKLHYYNHRDLTAAIASGSFLTDAMVVCPCSGSTLSAIVHGASQNLIHRAAEVHLKERRMLILVPRETPLSLVHLDNMRRAVEAGAVVLPAMPGFYSGAQSVRDLVDFVVGRICDQLEIAHSLVPRWGQK